MTVEFGVLIPTREAIMSGRPETGAAAGHGRAGRGGRLRLGVDRRLDHRAPAPRAAHADGRDGRPHAARPARHRRAAAGAAQSGRAGPRRRHARSRGRGPGDPRRRHRRRHAGHPQGVRRGRRAVRAPGRSLPRDARDLPRAVEPRQRQLQRQALHARRTSPSSPSRTVPAGRRSGSAAAARRRFARPRASTRGFRPDRAWSSSPSTSRGIQAAARAAGRAAGAVAGAAYSRWRSTPIAPPPRQRLHQFLETYYAAPARAIRARQAGYAGPLEGCVEWLQRWIDAGARHLVLRFAGGDQLAQVDEVASRLLPRLTRPA